MLLLFVALFSLTGCVKQLSPQGMTVAIPTAKITQSLQKEFPITQNTQYGQVSLSNPSILLKRGSDRITAGATVLFSNAFISQQRGSIQVSGKPYFDATTGNIYLHNPSIEKLQANGYKLASYMQGSIKQIILPIVDEIFKRVPIYKINRSSLQGSFVKNVHVEDGSLLVTFGL